MTDREAVLQEVWLRVYAVAIGHAGVRSVDVAERAAEAVEAFEERFPDMRPAQVSSVPSGTGGIGGG